MSTSQPPTRADKRTAPKPATAETGENNSNPKSPASPTSDPARKREVRLTQASPTSALESVLSFEDRLRGARNEVALRHIIVNELRKFVGARQVFLFQHTRRRRARISSVSSMSVADRDTPLYPLA